VPRAVSETAIEVPPPRHLFRIIVPPIVLPVFLAAADGTVVATALPAIAASFGEVERLPWLIIGNLIAGTVAAPAYGRLADLFGRRLMMIIALSIFMAASVLCAVAPTFEMLLTARVLQGLGGGGLMTLAQALVGEFVPPRERGTYQGYLSANIVAGSAFGPVAAGFLTEHFGWHSVFLAYLPIGLAAIALVLRVPKTQRPRGAAGSFDAAGLILLTTFVLPLLLAVFQLQRLDPGMLPKIGLWLGLAGAGFAALLWQQKRVSAPILSLPLLKLPAFWRADVMAVCSGAALTAMITFLPLYLQAVMGASPGEAGLLLIPLTVSVSSGSVLTGWLISRTGRTAVFPMVGLSITALTMGYLAFSAAGMTRVELSWFIALGGLCQGSAMLTAQITVQKVAGPRHLGAAAASAQLARSLGSAFGAAAAGAVLFGLLSLWNPDTAALFFTMVRRGSVVLLELPADQQVQVRNEIATAFSGVFLLVAAISCVSVTMAATLPVRRL
jgi:MFS family permease